MSHLVLFYSSVFLVQLPRLGKRELILVLFARLLDLCLFGFVGFAFLLVCGFVIVALSGLFSYLFFIWGVFQSLLVSHLSCFWFVERVVAFPVHRQLSF